MSQSGKDSGLMSSAGLVRYFESDKGVRVDPQVVLFIGMMLGVLVAVLKIILTV